MGKGYLRTQMNDLGWTMKRDFRVLIFATEKKDISVLLRVCLGNTRIHFTHCILSLWIILSVYEIKKKISKEKLSAFYGNINETDTTTYNVNTC